MKLSTGPVLRTSLTSAALLLTTVVPSAHATAWRITQEAWSESDERRFSEFVQAIGESGCRTADRCLKSPANPYRASDPAKITFRADCADFPYILRAYFAAKNGLPFSFVKGVHFARPSIERSRDIRYTGHGNRVLQRRDITISNPRNLPNLYRILTEIKGSLSSAAYRINPETETNPQMFSDVYPTRIDRDSIRPGTVIYDPNGHVAIVYKVEDDGRVRFMDGHPDNSVTRGTFSNRFARGRPAMGGGLKNWRPQRLVGARRDAETGLLIGGRVEAPTNADLGNRFSLVQYLGNNGITDPEQYRQARFIVNGQQVDYFEFVRTQLARGELRYHPVPELQNLIADLCNDIRDRVTAVEESINARIHDKPHPERLPDNIYGTNEMEWETYSTPSRDARMKTAFKDLRDQLEHFITLHRAGDPRVEYEGNDLAGDLLRTYLRDAYACKIEYQRSNGRPQELSLHEVSLRLWALSFDPYHCPERRWGASGEEASTCRDTANDTAWYDAQQFLRNQIDRTYDVRMGFSLRELQDLNPETAGVGVRVPPNVDTEGYLRSQAGR